MKSHFKKFSYIKFSKKSKGELEKSQVIIEFLLGWFKLFVFGVSYMNRARRKKFVLLLILSLMIIIVIIIFFLVLFQIFYLNLEAKFRCESCF